MSKLLCVGAMLALVVAGFSATAQSTVKCTIRPGDKAAVAGTLRTMYAAAMADDRAKFDSLLRPGFYMFDGGRRFEGDAIMDWAKATHAKGTVYVWTVTEPDVHVYCDEAWITYVNKGSMKTADGPVVPLSWLESAVLRRVRGGWKLVFFESTRVPPEAPAAN